MKEGLRHREGPYRALGTTPLTATEVAIVVGAEDIVRDDDLDDAAFTPERPRLPGGGGGVLRLHDMPRRSAVVWSLLHAGSPRRMGTERRTDPDGLDYHRHVTDEAAAWDSVSHDLITEIRAAESPEEAAAILERQAPWLAPLATWLRQNNAYAGWLSVVLTLIGLFVPSPADGDPPPPPRSSTQVETTLQEILEELQEADTPAPPSAPPEPPAAPGTTPPTP